MRWAAFGLGAVGGGLAAWAVWAAFRSRLEASFAAGQADLQRQLQAGSATLGRQLTAGEQQAISTLLRIVDASVPPQVDAALTTTLNRYGITPYVGQKIARLVNALPG